MPATSLVLTPMIDIVFQLIAFFVFAINYDRDQINAAIVPPIVESQADDVSKEATILEVDDQGRLLTLQGAVHPGDAEYPRVLSSLLEAVEENRSIVVRADQAAPYATVGCILQECRRRELTAVTLRVRSSTGTQSDSQ